MIAHFTTCSNDEGKCSHHDLPKKKNKKLEMSWHFRLWEHLVSAARVSFSVPRLASLKKTGKEKRRCSATTPRVFSPFWYGQTKAPRLYDLLSLSIFVLEELCYLTPPERVSRTIKSTIIYNLKYACVLYFLFIYQLFHLNLIIFPKMIHFPLFSYPALYL